MRVYKFLTSKYGLRAIREQRLKIAEVASLNDPFDLLPFDLSDPTIRKGVLASRTETGRDGGLLCFSQSWHNPVLWSHYAESHRGLCLGFDVTDDLQQSVAYVDRPFKLTHLDEDIANKMLFTKYEHWHYEQEIRMWATLSERSGAHYFYRFDSNLILKEVIAGAGCPVSQRKIVQCLGARRVDVSIRKARLAYDAFRVVEDENGFGDNAGSSSAQISK